MKVKQMMKLASNHPENQKIEIPIRQIHLRLWAYTKPNKGPFLVALLMIFCLSALQVLIPQVTRYTIDSVIPKKQFYLLPWVGISILVISGLTGIFNFLRNYFIAVFGHRTIDSLRRDLYQHIQQLSIGFLTISVQEI